MHAGFVAIVFTTLIQLPGTACFKLAITRNLNRSKELESSEQAHVEVVPVDPIVSVIFDIPLALSYSDAFVFFANDDKNVLQVTLKETVQGRLYEVPYKLQKELKGENTTKTGNAIFHRISGSFPLTWLPENYNKVNAAIIGIDGRYYNTYKIQNFDISLPDLMVVEEYQSLS